MGSMLMHWSHITPDNYHNVRLPSRKYNQRVLDILTEVSSSSSSTNNWQLNLKFQRQTFKPSDLLQSPFYQKDFGSFEFSLSSSCRKNPKILTCFSTQKMSKMLKNTVKTPNLSQIEGFSVRWIRSLIRLSNLFVFCYLQISFTSSILIMFLKIWKI